MRWRKEGPYLAISDTGYKVARYRVNGVDFYRPSLHGSFICAPLTDPRAANAECDRHHKQSGHK